VNVEQVDRSRVVTVIVTLTSDQGDGGGTS